MGTRVLDWAGLVRVAQRRDTAGRLITIAGIPARVRPHLAVDAGFYVCTPDEDGPYWALRSREEMQLLRFLVEAGEVATDDEEDPWRLSEWRHRLDNGERCFVAGCGSPDVDQRGPIVDTDGRMHLACPAHWEAITAVLGRQSTENPDVVEIRTHESTDPVRVMCAICGADETVPHDGAAHDAYVANLPPIERS